LIVAPWPQANVAAIDDEAEQHFGLLQEVITRIRDARNQANVEPARRVPVIMAAGEYLPMLHAQAPLIEFLARTEPPQLHAELAQKPEQAMSLLAGSVEIYLSLATLLDPGKELQRLDKEIAQAHQEIARIQGKLSNESFVTKAKPEVVEQERAKLAVQQERLAKLQERRGWLGA
jgi:valyl-tRNA synthetase